MNSLIVRKFFALFIFLQLLHKARLLNLIEQAQIPEVLFRNPLGLGLIQGDEIEHGTDRFGVGAQIFGDAGRESRKKSIHFRIRILEIFTEDPQAFLPIVNHEMNSLQKPFEKTNQHAPILFDKGLGVFTPPPKVGASIFESGLRPALSASRLVGGSIIAA